MRAISMLVIHHSASLTGSVSVFRQRHKAPPLSWKDVGYHEVITNGQGGPDGQIQRGRPHDQTGAGVFGANTGKLHVCLVGNFEKGDAGYGGPPTVAQMDALGHWLEVNARRYGVGSAGQVAGHREVALRGHGTACPGNQMPLDLVRVWCDEHGFVPRTGDPIELLGRWLLSQGVLLR
jgi:N-acetylmuramoyl-L-alanine amidase